MNPTKENKTKKRVSEYSPPYLLYFLPRMNKHFLIAISFQACWTSFARLSGTHFCVRTQKSVSVYRGECTAEYLENGARGTDSE